MATFYYNDDQERDRSLAAIQHLRRYRERNAHRLDEADLDWLDNLIEHERTILRDLAPGLEI